MKIILDGRTVEGDRHETILQAARKIGLYIPTLCHHEALSAYGSCRLCIVEITRRGKKRIVTSCNYELEEGLQVETRSPAVEKHRRMVMELLLARCPDVPVIRQMAAELGIEKSRFPLEHKDCLLCGLCVRACEEGIGAAAISFVQRGVEEDVSTPFHISAASCIGCGACAQVCPTGAIRLENIEGMLRIRKFHTSKVLHACPSCGKEHVTESHRDWMRPRLGPQAFWVSFCQECRRSGSARIALMAKYPPPVDNRGREERQMPPPVVVSRWGVA